MPQPIEYSSSPPAEQYKPSHPRLRMLFVVFCSFLLLLSALSFWRTQEIRITSINSADRGQYMLVINGIAYINLSPSPRFELGWRMNEQWRSIGYEYDEFPNRIEQNIYRYSRVGLYREPLRYVLSFPLPVPAIIVIAILGTQYFPLRKKQKRIN